MKRRQTSRSLVKLTVAMALSLCQFQPCIAQGDNGVKNYNWSNSGNTSQNNMQVVGPTPIMPPPPSPPSPPPINPGTANDYEPDTLLVMPNLASNAAYQSGINPIKGFVTLLAAHGCKITEAIGRYPTPAAALAGVPYRPSAVSPLVFVVRTPPGAAIETWHTLESYTAQIKAVQPNWIVRPLAVEQRFTFTPNDPNYPSQWNLGLMQVRPALEHLMRKGRIGFEAFRKIKLAVVDCGVSFKTDLTLVNIGYNAPQDKYGESGPDGNHGTMVATAAAANTHNKVAIASPGGYAAYVIPVKVNNSWGFILEKYILRAINFCAEDKVHIINLSLGKSRDNSLFNTKTNSVLHEYFKWFHDDKGGLIFLAAGNEGEELEFPLSPYVIGVSAIDRSEKKRVDTGFWGWQASYGIPIWFTAPGVEIPCVNRDGKVVQGEGTSISTPQVAGIAALIWQTNPRMTNKEVETILIKASDCKKLATVKNLREYGQYGLIDVLKAAKLAVPD